MTRRPERRRKIAPARRRRNRPDMERRRAETRRAIWILSVAGLAIAALAVVLFVTRPPQLDPVTGCPTGVLVPPEHTMVLVDQTDPLTHGQITYVKTLILAEYARLRPQGKLTIRPIGADPDSSGREFSRCRLRRGAEVLGVASNPDMVEAAFRKTVGDALNRYLNGLAHVPTSPTSPILEAVDAAMDAPDFGPQVKSRRLVIVSDLAQNSPLDSEYKGPGSGLALSPGVRDELARDMRGVAVRIHYVRRPNLASIQTPAQRAFWMRWFESNGADVKLGWGLQLVDPPGRSARRRRGEQG